MVNEFKGLDESGVKYSLSMRYDGSIENKKTVEQFKQLSEYFDGVYVAALRHLLELKKFAEENAGLYLEVEDLRDRVAALEMMLSQQKQQPTNEKKNQYTFGEE